MKPIYRRESSIIATVPRFQEQIESMDSRLGFTLSLNAASPHIELFPNGSAEVSPPWSRFSHTCHMHSVQDLGEQSRAPPLFPREKGGACTRLSMISPSPTWGGVGEGVPNTSFTSFISLRFACMVLVKHRHSNSKISTIYDPLPYPQYGMYNLCSKCEVKRGVPFPRRTAITSLALPTLYPKSRVVGSGLVRYMELCTVTRNLFIQSECVFSS